MFADAHIRREVAQACRILAALDMMDLWGHICARVPDSELIVTSPRFGTHCIPRTVTEDDLLITDYSGEIVDGQGILPVQFAMDLAVYKRRKDTRAFVYSTPRRTIAFGIARRALLRLTHGEAQVADQIGWLPDQGLILDGTSAEKAATLFDGKIACHQPGVGLAVVGTTLLQALTHVYHVEYLAQINYAGAAFKDLRLLTDSEISELEAQLAHVQGGRIATSHYASLFLALDPGPISHPWTQFASGSKNTELLGDIKAKMAFTSRMLWHQGTLVTFLEHASHRVPHSDRWLMTPAKPFHLMNPEDMVLLDGSANWLAGPRPAPFKRFHADIFAARPDVTAIVHTHEVYGRLYALAGWDSAPAIFRNGLEFAEKPMPCYATPDMIFREEARQNTVRALGAGWAVHELTHGTDYVGKTLEEATVRAIQREELLAMHQDALRLGEAHPLSQQTRSDILRLAPTAADWWWYYGGELGSPLKKVAGI